MAEPQLCTVFPPSPNRELPRTFTGFTGVSHDTVTEEVRGEERRLPLLWGVTKHLVLVLLMVLRLRQRKKKFSLFPVTPIFTNYQLSFSRLLLYTLNVIQRLVLPV